MKLTQEYLDKLNDKLDAVSDIEDYDKIENESLDVEKLVDQIRNFENNSLLADYAEGFLIAIGMDLEHISGFAQELAEKARECKREAEKEAEEAEAHAKAYSVPSI